MSILAANILSPELQNSEVPEGIAACPDFETVYSEHFDFVWRNLRRLGVPESSLRDASQEVFLVVHRRLPQFVPDGSLRSWLYSILRRVAMAQKRAARDRFPQGAEEADELVSEGEPNPESQASRGQSLRLLLALLAELDDDKRDAIVLVDIEGMSVPEACMALEVNPNTLYSRLRTARLHLRQRLMQGPIDPSFCATGSRDRSRKLAVDEVCPNQVGSQPNSSSVGILRHLSPRVSSPRVSSPRVSSPRFTRRDP